MRVIETRFGDEKLTLATLAHEVATSQRQLQRVFAEIGGTTFRSELQRVRMESAADLLREGSGLVKEVASAVGYREAVEFAKAFHRRYGAPPSHYRAGSR